MRTTPTSNGKDGRIRHNFRVLLGQSVAYTCALDLASPRLVLPFLYVALGAPVALAGLLLPLVQMSGLVSGVVAAPVVRVPGRSRLCICIGVLSIAAALVAIAYGARAIDGTLLVVAFVTIAAVIGMAQGLNGLAYQDLLGKSLPPDLRAPLMFTQAAIAGGLTLAIAWIVGRVLADADPIAGHVALIWVASIVSLFAAVLVFGVSESRSEKATGKAGQESYLKQLAHGMRSLSSVAWFRRYIGVRMMLLSVELAAPFYAVHAATLHQEKSGSLGAFVIGSSAGAVLGGMLWQAISKRSTRLVMTLAPIGAILAALLAMLVDVNASVGGAVAAHAAVFGLVSLAARGAAIGRLVYLSNATTDDNRAYYISISNAIVGLAGIAFAFGLGVLAQIQHVLWPLYLLLALSALSIVAVRMLPDADDVVASETSAD